MKIICIGRNYALHAAEMKSDVPTEPMFFMKPETALIPNKNPFFYPAFSKDVHHEVELVVRISRNGKHIEEQFAHRYYSEVTLGIDFTARDIQAICKQKGHPWEKAKAFDSSAPVGRFVELSSLGDVQNLNLELKRNGTTVQSGNTRDMIFSVDKLIAYLSQFMTLKMGDLLFTGTPEGVGPVSIGDELECILEGQQVMHLRVK